MQTARQYPAEAAIQAHRGMGSIYSQILLKRWPVFPADDRRFEDFRAAEEFLAGDEEDGEMGMLLRKEQQVCDMATD